MKSLIVNSETPIEGTSARIVFCWLKVGKSATDYILILNISSHLPRFMQAMQSVTKFYRKLGPDSQRKDFEAVQQKLPTELSTLIQDGELEYCFNIEFSITELQDTDIEKILWLITETFEPNLVSQKRSFLNIKDER